MKILLLHDYGTASGGAELQMLSLRQGLSDRGHQVRLFASSAMPVAGHDQLADDTCFGTTSRLQVLTQTANPSAYWRLRRVLREFQPDVVHIRMFMWQLSPLILPLLRQVPCIYQTAVYKAICPAGTKVLPDGSPCQVNPGRVCLTTGCLTPQTWTALMVQHQLWQRWRGAIDRVVALSQGMKAQLEQAGLSPVEVIYNGVPVRDPRPALSDPPTVVFAGRLVPEKGVDVLLKAFAVARSHIPTAQLLIAGQGPEAESLKALAQQLGLGGSVTWLGHVSRPELEAHFDHAWVQAVPSQWEEPFGNVTTEAMMRGTTVVASAVGAQPEIIHADRTGFLVHPSDAEGWGDRLTRLLQDRELAEAMGRAGRDRALAQFSEASRTDQFLALYRQIQAQYAKNLVPVVHPNLSSL
ncbi:glycosyltransferase family 4 protein [Phormidium tenue]|uniref:Group 1 glycosyl transferase n=1 Tax=Phormidium tenue NIES-30 TaxID=549789 RepID=A0A1U7J1E9_9CYAN|nr:glycosyltransferase family 4 protein [Phormidium tenue]MBD2232255.1 glycosyltransferase family 4 protein [Phormidium tenue FACHB-1052]OKH45810.1 group 1 glycosyl transferase [Phormidium tenue NIES-30]